MAHDERVAPKVRASHHSLSGCRHGESPRHSLLARADAAHQAGISEIGACASDLGSWDPRELRHLVDGHHVRVAEVEWIDLGELHDKAEDDLFRLARILGATQLNAGVCSPDIFPDGYLARRLRDLALRAADQGMTVAFEPVVFGSVGDIVRVQHIIQQAGQPNVGTLLDVYHMGRYCWDSLHMVLPELVAGIQINGLSQRRHLPDWPYGLLREAQCDRLLPDDGDFPVTEWLKALIEMGVPPGATLSVEVLSDEQRALTVFDAAGRIAESARPFYAMWAGQ